MITIMATGECVARERPGLPQAPTCICPEARPKPLPEPDCRPVAFGHSAGRMLSWPAYQQLTMLSCVLSTGGACVLLLVVPPSLVPPGGPRKVRHGSTYPPMFQGSGLYVSSTPYASRRGAPASPLVHCTHAGFGSVEHDIGALRGERSMSRSVPAAPVGAGSTSSGQARSMGRASPEPVMGGGGGIEIPAFLRRRRMQGK